MPQAVIDAILQNGSGFENGKYRIALHFQQSLSAQENADFLKREYGTGGRLPALIGTDIHMNYDSKGITLTRGSIMNPDTQVVLPWMNVQKRIGELLAAGRYLNRKEAERLPAFAEEQEESCGCKRRKWPGANCRSRMHRRGFPDRTHKRNRNTRR